MLHARFATVWCPFVMIMGNAYDPCEFLNDENSGLSTYNKVCQNETDDGSNEKFCDQYLVLGNHDPPLIKVFHHGNPKWVTRSTFNRNPRKEQPRDSTKSDQNLPEAWYIFLKPGNVHESLNMPTENPITGCGTRHPAWMNGTLPRPTEYNVSRTVCIHNQQPCSATYNIFVRNCGSGIMAYFLTPLTQHVLSAYCFGNYRPCQGNTSSETGFSPGCRATCGKPRVIKGRVAVGERERVPPFLEGSRVIIDCNGGFSALNTKMTCSNSGWTPSSVECKENLASSTPSDIVWIIPLVVLLLLLLSIAAISFCKYRSERGNPFSGRQAILENHDVLRHKLVEAVHVGACIEPALEEYKKFCMDNLLVVRMDVELCKEANEAIEELKEKNVKRDSGNHDTLSVATVYPGTGGGIDYDDYLT